MGRTAETPAARRRRVLRRRPRAVAPRSRTAPKVGLTGTGFMARRILVTAALPYANGPIHIGHLVEYVQTDIWVRFQKLCGHRCFYFCADDTHGTPVMISARAAGITPEQLIEQVHREHTADFDRFYVQFDNYY